MNVAEGYVVGIDITEAGKIYTVILYKYNKNAQGPKWSFSLDKVAERILKAAINAKKVVINNVELTSTGDLKGTTGSLDRFNPKVNIGYYPVVALAELRVADGSERLLGYKIADREGKVKNIRLDDFLGYCRRITKIAKRKDSDTVPIQNCMFVSDTADKKGTIKGYIKNQLIVEYIPINKPSNTHPAKLDKAENKRQVSKLEELFTPEQIYELKLGKRSGVDIRLYGNNKLSAAQMRALRIALEDKVDIKAFADPSFTAVAMKAYHIQSKYGVDISSFVNPEYTIEQIYELGTAWIDGIDISKMANPKLEAHEMSKIRIEEGQKLWTEDSVSVLNLISTYEAKGKSKI